MTNPLKIVTNGILNENPTFVSTKIGRASCRERV